MKKISYTGRNSRVGKALEEYGAYLLDCDVTNEREVNKAIENDDSSFIVHLAGKSSVDFCEAEENRKYVIDTNFNGFVKVATVAEKWGIPVVVISSEHIFDGKSGNYKEDTKGKFKNPVNFYGQTKIAVEAAASAFDNVKVVRTSTLFDSDCGLIKQYLDPLKAGQSVEVPTFITRSFMYVPHFAKCLYEYVQPRFHEMPKTLHISGCKSVSWYTFVYYLAEVYRADTSLVHPRKKELDVFGAPRPNHGGLNVKMSARLGLPQYDYMDGLREMRAADLIGELTNE